MAFRLPSVEEIVRTAGETYFRFPFTLISAMLFTVSALFLIDSSGPVMGRLIMTAALGLPLLFAVESYLGLNAPSASVRWGMTGGALILLTVYGILAPQKMFLAPEIHSIRFTILIIGCILLATFLPVLHSRDGQLFWNFNKRLFLRIVTTVPFTVILYAGLAIGLAAVDNLFGVDVNPRWYLRIWVCVAGMFNTWFFLAGVPHSLQAVAEDTDYPKPLRLFTMNVLLPLVLVYVVILYLYTGKILMEWEWPKGWVGYLVLGFSGTGIFSLLLAWPLKQDTSARWLRFFSRAFHIALLPLCILLLLAIWRRIDEYGMTENRYYVVLSGIWLFGIALYYTIRPAGNIRLIPVSLSVIALMTAYGSWSPFAVSEAFQLHRLEQLLQRNGITAAAPQTTTTGFRVIPFEDNKEISNILQYMLDHFGPEPLEPYFPEGSMAVVADREHPPLEAYMAALNIPVIHPWQKEPVHRSMVYLESKKEPVPVTGYDLLLQEVELTAKDSVAVQSFPAGTLRWELTDSALTVQMIREEGGGTMPQRFDLTPFLQRSGDDVTPNDISSVVLPPSDMELSAVVGTTGIKLIIAELRISMEQRSVTGLRFRPLLAP